MTTRLDSLRGPTQNNVPFEILAAGGRYAPEIASNVKFGYNPTITTATDPEDIWNNGGTYTGQPLPSVTPEKVEVLSGSDVDTALGTGARTVVIQGLDENWEEASETITLAGQTTVDSENTYRRVSRGYVATAGSGQANAGAITCRYTTSTSVVFWSMLAGYNQTTVAAVTVPANRVFFLTNLHIAVALTGGGASASAIVRFLSRDNTAGGVYRSQRVETITPDSPLEEVFTPYVAFGPKTDLLCRVDEVSATMNASARFGYYRLPDSP